MSKREIYLLCAMRASLNGGFYRSGNVAYWESLAAGEATSR